MGIDEMDISSENRTEGEIERLRDSLELETRHRLQVQRHLERANTDFEEFVSVASHGLLESLRAIGSYSELIAETYAGQLDSNADLFFGRIQDGVAKMQSLLADMVEYWTAYGGGPQSSLADMEAVLRQAALCADKQIKEGNAIVTHDPLPAVMGNFEMLTRVLRHLIVNAVKFCGASFARIHISCRREHLECVFSVQDNGPGIEPAFRERIFGVFKRLHGNEYPGVGLGLAFCKKAIEWHGGRIWVESTPGEGATFYFTLPIAD
jgi:light-regulated signal transduction histidine kinase (bacteriophytochrome)